MAFLLATPLCAGWIGTSGEATFDHFEEFSPAIVRSLGGAGSALLDGTDAWFLQPAATPRDEAAFSFHFSDDAFGGKNGTAAGAYRIDSLTFRLAIGGSLLGSISGRDNKDQPTGLEHHPRSTLLSTGLAMRHGAWEWGYAMGLATDRITQEEQSALGWWLDAGTRYTLSRKVSLALAMRRLGRRINSYTEDGDPSGSLPAEIVLGGAFVVDPKGEWNLAIDLFWPAFGEPSAAAGLEWSPLRFLQVRGGTRIDLEQVKWIADRIAGDGERDWKPQQQEVFGAGIGFTPSHWGFDYSLTLLRDGAGLRHALSFRWMMQ